MRRRILCQSVLGLAALPAFSHAQGNSDAFPARQVNIVVPFAAGQSGDILARLVGDGLSKLWSKPVVVDNKVGAGGTVGSKAVAGMPGDGYTLLLGSSGPMVVAPNLYKNAGYDPRRDFAPIMNVAGVAQLLVVAANSPHKTVQELVAAAKAAPGKLSYGSGGAGSFQHLTMEMFKQRSGAELQHVPYKGSSPAYNDLFGGRLDAMFDSQPAVMGFLQSGRARVLAVSTPQRVSTLPEIPTIAESGYAGFDALGWLGIVAPGGLDQGLRNRLNTDLRKVLAMPEVKAKLASMGMLTLASSPEEFAKTIDGELTKWAGVIKTANITL